MANLVLGLATSHTPILALSADQWEARARNDRSNPRLWDTEGVPRSYAELEAIVGDRYASEATPARWSEQYDAAQRDLDRLGAALAEARPDVAIIIGDDEQELFSLANFPAFALFYGRTATTQRMRISPDPAYAWRKTVALGYGQDDNHQYPAAPELALALIEGLLDAGFDLSALSSVPEPERHGFGHAYGFVVTRLMDERRIPIVPVMVNCYYPPNQPRPARCFAFGNALRAAIEAAPSDARVAVIASGGLSHFVTNEALDRAALDALARDDDRSALATLPAKLLNDGSSEVRNWIVLGGALGPLRNTFLRYYPVYRTPAGTGVGMAFGIWR
jgi:3-O-methylgallate 3,4-dioxygenase